jgi:hypothetical protein
MLNSSKISETKNRIDTIGRICQLLKLEQWQNVGENVCNFGEKGDKFYVIVSGTVAVYVPIVCNSSMSKVEFYQFINEHQDMILEIDGNEKYELPKIPDKIINEPKAAVGKTQSLQPATFELELNKSLKKIKDDYFKGNITPEERK